MYIAVVIYDPGILILGNSLGLYMGTFKDHKTGYKTVENCDNNINV